MRTKAVVVVAVGGVVAALALAPLATSATRGTRSHHHKSRITTAKAATGGDVTCKGTQTTNVGNNLIVPSNTTCTVAHTVTVGNDIFVNSGATLIDQGAHVMNDIQATSPKGIGIGGFGTQSGVVGNNITITGTSGAGPGTVTPGDNYICNTKAANNITVNSSLSTAGKWVIGDRDEECSGGGNVTGNDLFAEYNKNHLDISDNERGAYPYSQGITWDLWVLYNTLAPVVESNFIGHNANCQAGTTHDLDWTHNTVGHLNFGCP